MNASYFMFLIISFSNDACNIDDLCKYKYLQDTSSAQGTPSAPPPPTRGMGSGAGYTCLGYQGYCRLNWGTE